MRLIFFLICHLAVYPLLAQSEGKIKVYQDSRVDSLLRLEQTLNKFYPMFPGWRIQIFFESGTSSKVLAKQARDEFNEKYPSVDVYLIFRAPYYKVMAGDFRTKVEAEAFLKEIAGNYPNAFIVKDFINPPRKPAP